MYQPLRMPTPREFEDRYGFRVCSLTPFPNSERTWHVEGRDRALVLRLHGPEHQANHAAEIAALRFLEKIGHPAPRLLTTRDGEVITRWGEKAGYVTTFVPGAQLEPGVDAARQVGRTVGWLHAQDVGAGLAETNFTVSTKREHFRRLDADLAVRAWEGYATIRDELASAWEQLPDLSEMPRALIHTDVLFHNVIRTPTGELVLIDWEGAGIGPAIQDIGYFLSSYAIPSNGEEFRMDITQAFLDGYTSVRPLSPEEWQHIPDALVFGNIFHVLWYSMVVEKTWRRTRYALNHREQIAEKLLSMDSAP